MAATQKHKPDYILGVDIGTSSSKALAFTVQGKVLAQRQVGYDTAHRRPSFSEQDADQIFGAVMEVIHSVVTQMKRQQPLCVSFSAAMHSLMAVDEKGRATSPLMIWSDGRSQVEADHLKKQQVSTKIYQHTGTPIHPMSPLCKLLWWKKEEKESFKRAVRFISIKEYIFSRLFGEYLADYSLASATGLFDNKALKWYAPALDVVGLKASRLSTPVTPLHHCKGMKTDFAKQTGLHKDTPFVLGASDGCLANLGTGVTQPGELALTIGTSGAIRLFNDKPVNDRNQGLFNYLLLEQEFISGGAINNGGVLLDWFRLHFMKESKAKESYGDFLKEALKAEAGSNGLLFLPYLQGERAPMWDAQARGAFIGINIDHERQHFMRAVLEGICFSLYDIAHLLHGKALPIREVYASGGFTRSAGWVQMLADLFDKKVKVTGLGDASSVGAALLGMRAMGIIQTWEEAEEFIPVRKTFTPGATQTELYRRNYAVFAEMYALLKPAFHEIAGWQNTR